MTFCPCILIPRLQWWGWRGGTECVRVLTGGRKGRNRFVLKDTAACNEFLQLSCLLIMYTHCTYMVWNWAACVGVRVCVWVRMCMNTCMRACDVCVCACMCACVCVWFGGKTTKEVVWTCMSLSLSLSLSLYSTLSFYLSSFHFTFPPFPSLFALPSLYLSPTLAPLPPTLSFLLSLSTSLLPPSSESRQFYSLLPNPVQSLASPSPCQAPLL